MKNAYRTKHNPQPHHTLQRFPTPQTTELLHFGKKEWVQAWASPGGGDWVVVLPTQKLLQTNLAMEGRTDTQTPYKTNHPSTLYGCGWKYFSTLFFYLSQNGMSSLCLLAPFCWIKFLVSLEYLLRMNVVTSSNYLFLNNKT